MHERYHVMNLETLYNTIPSKSIGINEKRGKMQKFNFLFTKTGYNKSFLFQKTIDMTERRVFGAYYTPFNISIKIWLRTLHIFFEFDNFGLKLIKSLEEMIENKMDLDSVNFYNGLIEHERFKKNTENSHVFINKILNLKWLDMSAGAGCFAYSYLYILERLLWMSGYELENFITKLASNIYLNDIDTKAIEEIKKVFSNVSSEFEIPFNIYNYDALIQLDLDEEIKLVLKDGGFDILVGNPPYLGERGNVETFQRYKRHEKTLDFYTGKMDLLYFFVHKGIEYLKPKGILGYITTEYFATADNAFKLRKYLREEIVFKEIYIDDFWKSFDDLTSISLMISILKKKSLLNNDKLKEEIDLCKLSLYDSSYFVKQNELYDVHGNLILEKRDSNYIDASELNQKTEYTLGDFFDVNQGVVSGSDRLNFAKAKKYSIMEEFFRDNGNSSMPIFVYTKKELEELNKKFGLSEDELVKIFKPFIKGSDIKNRRTNLKELFLLYAHSNNIAKYKGLLEYLNKFKKILSKRREVELGYRKWYELQWSRNPEIFDGVKIIVPSRSAKMHAIVSKEPLYASADVYYIRLKEMFRKNESHELKVLEDVCSYLNEDRVENWFRYMGKKKGKLLELYATPLKKLPIEIDLASTIII